MIDTAKIYQGNDNSVSATFIVTKKIKNFPESLLILIA